MTTTKDLTIRPADPAADSVRIAQLMSAYEGEPVTPENIIDTFSRFKDHGHFGRFVAIDANGLVIAYAKSTRMHSDKAGRFVLTVIVDEDHRNRGLGRHLADLCEGYALDRGGMELIAEVREDNAPSIAFAEKRGYVRTHHFFESVLDVSRFAFDRAGDTGDIGNIEVTSVGADGSDASAFRRLFEICKIADEDAPGGFEMTMSFEEFCDVYIKAKWFDAFGHIVAKVDDRYVALSAVGEMTPGRFYTLNTGVRGDYRGRGLATLLKTKAIEYAKARGATKIRTHNHSENAPMLAINKKLGFEPEIGWYYMTKCIEREG